MMATAFEFPRNEKRKHFVEHMERENRTPEFRTDTRTDNSGKTHTLSLVGCWAWDFYELRSRIVHGEPPRATQRRIARLGGFGLAVFEYPLVESLVMLLLRLTQKAMKRFDQAR